ncbi:MAG TPA: type IX secretion system plug protein domain-containing protein, partial [Bacteroidia bacterium]|nr:type IX secretion system plug protein domain-containing protein [Bacteroidia bacterium]
MKRFLHMFIFQSFLLTCLLQGMNVYGQLESAVPFEEDVYKKTIKTVELRNPDFELSQPVLHLNASETLKLSFDELTVDLQRYSYTFIHCNADWTPSNLLSSEFIDGFAENAIADYQYSANTLQKYIHYSTVFPNTSLRFTKSGNYLLKVYPEGNPDTPVLTRRFLVVDT